MKKFLYRDGYKVKYLLTFASAKKHYLPSRLFFLFFWIEMSAFIPIKRLTLCHINTLVSAQGTESTVMIAAGVVDEISYANAAADQQSHILIPLYGPEGIQGGVVGYNYYRLGQACTGNRGHYLSNQPCTGHDSGRYCSGGV